MKVENYKNLLEEFNKDIKFDHELKKKLGSILEESLKFFTKQIILKI